MNRHRSQINEFNALIESYQTGRTRKEAYEMAENDWVMIHGVRRFKSYRGWYLSYNKSKRVKPRLAKPETIRFIEIFDAVSSPNRYMKDNYELAEQEYEKRYGRRRFGSLNSFYVSRVKVLKKQKAA